MSESDKPIFPRQPENADELDEKAEKALENLVKEEKYTTDKGRIIFCPSCFQRINFEDIFCPHCGSVTDPNYKQEKPIPMSPNVYPVEYGPPPMDLENDDGVSLVYGPPPMNLRDREKFPVIPAYGPPPISIFNYKLWLILIPVFLVIMILIAVIAFLLLRIYA